MNEAKMKDGTQFSKSCCLIILAILLVEIQYCRCFNLFKSFGTNSGEITYQRQSTYKKYPSALSLASTSYWTRTGGKNSTWPDLNIGTTQDDKIVPEGYEMIEEVAIQKAFLAKVPNLGDTFQSLDIPNTICTSQICSVDEPPSGYGQVFKTDDIVLADIVRNRESAPITRAFLRGGPRGLLHFDPQFSKAAIVTCGGLCPGLNDVIRELVVSLHNNYNCNEVYGIRGGFNGFHDPSYPPIKLDCDAVKGIHHQGGTILGSARGGFDLEKIIGFLVEGGFNQLYIVGGDGTHRGAHVIAEEVLKRNLNIAVAGIPKTIDNDIDIIDQSFGFGTAVEAAQLAIHSAKIEAECSIPRGIVIVKLMGRYSGFIASHATLGSGDVDLCLVPEVDFDMEGPTGVFAHLKAKLDLKGHAVIVVAEGAGEKVLGQNAETDAGGNRILPDVGDWLQQQLKAHFDSIGLSTTIRYINPSYMVRSVPANSADSHYCMTLAQNAVHGAMAGYTGFSVGLVCNHIVYIPIPVLTKNSPRLLDPKSRIWDCVVSETQQPNDITKYDVAGEA
mmetsp:Transcript_24064/g.30080  ORF Transcript_24064/g.30080 Transcript_24064/m.30080 type:complete len:558 (-) Transcript_24064:420-2093(-)